MECLSGFSLPLPSWGVGAKFVENWKRSAWGRISSDAPVRSRRWVGSLLKEWGCRPRLQASMFLNLRRPPKDGRYKTRMDLQSGDFQIGFQEIEKRKCRFNSSTSAPKKNLPDQSRTGQWFEQGLPIRKDLKLFLRAALHSYAVFPAASSLFDAFNNKLNVWSIGSPWNLCGCALQASVNDANENYQRGSRGCRGLSRYSLVENCRPSNFHLDRSPPPPPPPPVAIAITIKASSTATATSRPRRGLGTGLVHLPDCVHPHLCHRDPGSPWRSASLGITTKAIPERGPSLDPSRCEPERLARMVQTVRAIPTPSSGSSYSQQTNSSYSSLFSSNGESASRAHRQWPDSDRSNATMRTG